MISLDQISSIGIGTYRMNVNNPLHYSALCYSIDKGINLIDTASNYQGGDSERLVGRYILEKGRQGLFVITKAGYIQGQDIQKFSKYLTKKDTIKINDEFYYSLNQEFLNAQIQASLDRLNSKYIDGFLIHNPEYLLENSVISLDDFYNILWQCWDFLHKLSKSGVIRYYGISSNILVNYEVELSKLFGPKTNRERLKLVQFPHNLIEKE